MVPFLSLYNHAISGCVFSDVFLDKTGRKFFTQLHLPLEICRHIPFKKQSLSFFSFCYLYILTKAFDPA
jgi:hypothetical protein